MSLYMFRREEFFKPPLARLEVSLPEIYSIYPCYGYFSHIFFFAIVVLIINLDNRFSHMGKSVVSELPTERV